MVKVEGITRMITIERRMNPNRIVSVYTERDTAGTVVTRYEQDMNTMAMESLLGRL